MKHIIILLTMLLISIASYANIVRNEDTFKIEKTTLVNKDKQTKYTWEDKEGKSYPIFITKRNACYIIRISKKTGKEYKYYLPKEVQEQIRQELNINKK